uniref:(-)-delta-cadinene synthase n=1 Tax=Streptomyces corallincola TaxID=2851888 RepID=UPI001FE414E7|nr:terpene synthase [Streptomyces corallincola]
MQQGQLIAADIPAQRVGASRSASPVLAGSAVWDLPARCSPYARAADEAATSWAESAELSEDPVELGNLRRIRPGLLAAWCHPDAGEADLALVAMWMSWLFLLDDRIDESALGRDADQLELYLEGLQAVALGLSGPDSPMGRALAEIIERACADMPTGWRLRFRRNVADYLAACVWQAAHRQGGQVPSLAEFPSRRRAFGAVMPMFDLIEKTDRVLLPASLHSSRPGQDMLLAAADLVCWTNDLMTADKEAAYGDPHNLVLVTAHHRELDRQAAVGIVADACEERLRTHYRAHRELTGSHGEADHYAAALLIWVRGHLEWGLRTPRYDAEGTPAAAAVDATAEGGSRTGVR